MRGSFRFSSTRSEPPGCWRACSRQPAATASLFVASSSTSPRLRPSSISTSCSAPLKPSPIALPRAHLVLPIGISFFSFQLISYLADRMRKDAPVYPLRPFALFVLLFPHLIAGPIVRHNELVPQFDEDPRRDGVWARICLGLILFTIGLAKKVLLADRLAEIADPLFTQAAGRGLTFGEAWSAALAFTFQLFCD